MTTTLTTVTETSTALTVAEVQALTWTNKAGKTLSAHSLTGQAFAPKAARVSAAHAATLAQLQCGQFRPFLRDLLGALAAPMLAGLSDCVFKNMAVIVDGVAMVPAGNTLAPEMANKKVLHAAAQWALAPYTLKKVKGVIDVQPVAKLNGKQSALLAVLLDFAGLTEQPTEAGTIEAEATEATAPL